MLDFSKMKLCAQVSIKIDWEAKPDQSILIILRIVWLWFNVRCVPLIPEKLLRTQIITISATEIFLQASEVSEPSQKASWGRILSG